MKYYQLFENADYNIARKQFNLLSDDAKTLLIDWMSDKKSTLIDALTGRKNSHLAQEIWEVGQPIRDNIQKRCGDTITLYRGIKADTKTGKYLEFNTDRPVFSWTSSEKIARKFSGQYKSLSPIITDQDIKNAMEKLENKGVLKFLGIKFVKNKKRQNRYAFYRYPDYDKKPEKIFNQKQTIEKLKDKANKRNRIVKDLMPRKGHIFEKNIPVNDILWVLMYENENEYIVRDIHNEILSIIREF